MNLADHVGHGKTALFLRNLRVKDDLQKQVAHLLGELRVVPGVECLQHLVSLFEQVGSQAPVRLLAVPGTALGGAQTRLHGDEFFKPLAGSQLFHLRATRLPRGLLGCFALLFRARRHRFLGFPQSESNVPL